MHMVVEVACTCDDLPPHSHVYERARVAGPGGLPTLQMVPTDEVRIWVDWKAVARELAVSQRT